MDYNTGIILKGVGGKYSVFTDAGAIDCTMDGKIRLGPETPMTGDMVQIDKTGESYHISKIFTRKNALVRPAVANIDKLFVVASNAPPKTDYFFIDKISVICSVKNIKMVLLLNKIDLDANDKLYDIYKEAEFKVIRVSAVTGEGIDLVRHELSGNISAFTGNSGIGKSSILNRIDPRFKISVGDISKKIERGKHTTRHVELLQIGEKSFVADTPGFSSFEISQLDSIDKRELQMHFPEIRKMLGNCRFADCVHINEPDCPVKQTLLSSEQTKSRYDSYKKMYEALLLGSKLNINKNSQV